MYPRSLGSILLALATLAAGCGGDSSGGITGPPDNPPPPPGGDDPDQTGPAPVGTVMYAVDLTNNFIVFGSGSIATPTAMMKVTGLPILKRIIGLVIRPSDNALIGIGNDSRVYRINPLTAQATPISGGPFSSPIASFFDTHFAMALEPNGERVRLIAAESGANWSVSIHDGTATTGKSARYGTGTAHAGRTPRLLGIVYPHLPAGAKGAGWCPNLAYAVDAEKAIMLASCDPDKGYWFPTGITPPGSTSTSHARSASSIPYDREFEELKDTLLRCGEFMMSPDGSNSEGENQPASDAGPWFPRSPDTEFYVFLVKIGEKQAQASTVKLIDGQKWGMHLGPRLPSPEPVQSVVFDRGGPYGSSNFRGSSLRQAPVKVQHVKEGDAPASDPGASCN